jgi:MoaA/NifB/PqqE/SkfB family radical SAM enzyme
MNIQSISIVVPTKRCMNDCPFCVSKMHDNEYENSFDTFQMSKRIKYAVNNGVNTAIITGTGEAMQNKAFLEKLAKLFEDMNHPFPNVELQTTGVLLLSDITNIQLLTKLGVNTISLSISDVFDNHSNMRYIGVPKKVHFKLDKLIPFLKDCGFNIRLSLNMTSAFDGHNSFDILKRAKELGANQVTFRKLYTSGNDSPEDQWVEKNSCNESILEFLISKIRSEGIPLYRLPYGPMAYSIEGMSVVLDDDCMSKENNDSLKYVILREDGKLYCRWDDKGSLIF